MCMSLTFQPVHQIKVACQPRDKTENHGLLSQRSWLNVDGTSKSKDIYLYGHKGVPVETYMF